MGRFEIVFFGLILFFCSILIDLCIRTLEAGKTFEWGPLSGWASAFVAMVAVGFASLSYRNSRRSLDLSNMSYMAKVIETFANRANEIIERVQDTEDNNTKEDLLFHFIYEVYKISDMVKDSNKQIEILYAYLNKKAIMEIKTAAHLYICFSKSVSEFLTIYGIPDRDIAKDRIKVFYEEPIKEYEFVHNLFKKHGKIEKGNYSSIYDLKLEFGIQ